MLKTGAGAAAMAAAPRMFAQESGRGEAADLPRAEVGLVTEAGVTVRLVSLLPLVEHG